MDSNPQSGRKSRNHLIWIGLLLTLFGVLSYFLYFARFATLRDFPWLNLPIVIGGLACSTIAAYRAFAPASRFRGKILGSLALALSLLFAGLFITYVFYLSYLLPDSANAPQRMAMAPEFTLLDQSGEPVSLSDFRGMKVVLVFYRGYW